MGASFLLVTSFCFVSQISFQDIVAHIISSVPLDIWVYCVLVSDMLKELWMEKKKQLAYQSKTLDFKITLFCLIFHLYFILLKQASQYYASIKKSSYHLLKEEAFLVKVVWRPDQYV